MRSILVPTDFSSCAAKAFEYAVTIAGKSGAAVNLLHISTAEEEDGNRSNEQALEQELEQWKEKGSGNIIINTHVVRGSVEPEILNAVTTFAADLIVMGTKGASGFKKAVVGSHTANIISKASIPVLSIPAGYSQTGISKIVLAINNAEEDLENLSPLFELARIFFYHFQP